MQNLCVGATDFSFVASIRKYFSLNPPNMLITFRLGSEFPYPRSETNNVRPQDCIVIPSLSFLIATAGNQYRIYVSGIRNFSFVAPIRNYLSFNPPNMLITFRLGSEFPYTRSETNNVPAQDCIIIPSFSFHIATAGSQYRIFASGFRLWLLYATTYL